MKICHLGDASVIHTWRWVDYMQKMGYETHLISLKPPREEFKNPNVNIYVVPKKNLRNPINIISTIIKIRKLVKKINPDLINAHYITHYGFLAAMTGKPFICSAWGADVNIMPKKSRIIKFLTKYILKKALAVTCDAHHMARSLEGLGATKDKIKIIFYGVDLNKDDPDKFRSKYPKEDNGNTIVTVRQLEPRYDPETIIRAVPYVKDEFPNTKFIIIGDGSQKKYLEELAKSLDCSKNVEFTGRIVNEDLPKYFVRSDIYVSTSLSDGGLSSATAEAMACELPVVVTAFGDNEKWVEDGKTGFIIPLQDPKSLAQRITKLLRNKKIGEKMGKINRQIIKTRLNMDVEMKKLDQLYKNLINGIKTTKK